ncbi:PQQ-binding-like beta-propeller repeat protein [Actinocrispum sp. NPDC049592]|uniref:outer membrane protein assembly factor BamB family protein n=1 Tax=Actinocrispum sp. NPDC049592 TaxID=3154835 RepID=UPI00341220CB
MAIVAVAGVIAGCGGGKDQAQPGQPQPSDAPSTPTSTKPQKKSFDPPRSFGSGAKTVLETKDIGGGQAPVVATLADGVVYSNGQTGGKAIDALTGEQLWTVKPSLEAMTYRGESHPPVAAMDTVYFGFPVRVPGKGTTPAHPAAEVVAVDKESGKDRWRTTIDVETSDPGNVTDGVVTLVGVDDQSVVLTWYSQNFSVGNTYVVDSGSHQVRWKKDQYLAGDVASGIVLGNAGKPSIAEERTLQALSVTDGTEKWATKLGQYAAGIQPLSPKLVAVDKGYTSKADQTFEIEDLTTGKALYSQQIDNDFSSHTTVECFWDQADAIVCSVGSKVLGFDVNNVGPKPQWEIAKDSSRTPPSVTAAYHGLVYGETQNGPLTLDAKTGKDSPDDPIIAPILVDKYVGITIKGDTHVATK